MCDESQHFATVGESEPTGDKNHQSLPTTEMHSNFATQSVSSLESALPGDLAHTLQTFRRRCPRTLG